MLVVSIKAGDLAAFAPHRHRDGWEIATHPDSSLFLKVPPSETNGEFLRHLPCLKRWTLDEKDSLIPLGKSLPEILLPSLDWLPLASLLPVTTTRVHENEPFFGHLGFELIRTTKIQPATALFLPFEHFAAWAETAPALRLDRLTFALSDAGITLIIGQPLPPLPGRTFHRDGSVFLPCGWTLPNFLLPEDLAKPDQFLLIESDQTAHLIARELCLPVTRATVRTTSASL